VKRFLAAANRLGDDPKPFTEREFVERVLAFANGAKLVGNAIDLVAGVARGVDTEADRWDYRKHELVPDAVRAAKWLETILEGGPLRSLGDEVLPLAHLSVLRPTYKLRGRRIEVQYQHFAARVEAAVAYGVLLMLDSERDYAKNLCRCKYTECNRFFLAVKPRTGRPRRDYCTPACFKAARVAGGPDRVRVWREKQKQQKSQRRRRQNNEFTSAQKTGNAK
jgi:hypothetical protein